MEFIRFKKKDVWEYIYEMFDVLVRTEIPEDKQPNSGYICCSEPRCLRVFSFKSRSGIETFKDHLNNIKKKFLIFLQFTHDKKKDKKN